MSVKNFSLACTSTLFRIVHITPFRENLCKITLRQDFLNEMS